MRYQELEETLCRLPTVDAARVVGENGTISEIHILGSPGKTPKQVVRDVQSLAMARFGLTVDRRVISVVQIENEEIGRGDRPAIVDILEEPVGSKLTVTVTLAWRNEMITGVASGPSAATTRLRSVGEATVAALEHAIGDDAAVALAALETPTIGTRQVAVAQIVIVSGGEERVLVGSALVGANEAQAAVRAVLDAVNRIVPSFRR
ncbi:MAG TPA: hypothetical protein VLT15_08635 [Acidimicrobiia bacterium]|nr:hypothetical protein [Acidimicrobiia bacterium]